MEPDLRVEQNAATTPLPKTPTPGHQAWQLCLLALICSSVLFFDGCDQDGLRFTLGTPPFLRVKTDKEVWLSPIELVDFWPLGLVLHGLLVAALLYILLFGRHPKIDLLRKSLTSGRVWAPIVLTAFAFNSFLYLPILWMYVVFYPLLAAEVLPPDASMLQVAAATRFQFILTTFALGLLLWGISWAYLKITKREKWWQVSLGTILAIMTIIGTLLGLLGRLMLAE